MAEKLNATVQRQDGALAIKLTGIIDEDNRLSELADRLGAGRALIDLGDVERINSCGTRDWVNWIADLEARGVQPVLVGCSPAIVAQLNLVKNFSGGAIVKSFYVPYHCPDCDVEKVLLVDVADLGPPPHEPPACRCDECDCVMDFDDMADSYFAFLSARHRASAQWIDQEIARGSSPSLKLRSRTSQASLASRASAPLLPALRPSSRPRLEAPSRPRIDATPATMAVPSLAARPASAPRIEVSPPAMALSVKILIGLLLSAIAVLAVLVVLR